MYRIRGMLVAQVALCDLFEIKKKFHSRQNAVPVVQQTELKHWRDLFLYLER